MTCKQHIFNNVCRQSAGRLPVNTSSFRMTLMLAVFSLVLLEASRADPDCYAFKSDPYLNLSAKTSYEYVRSKRGIAHVPGCKAIQLWFVGKHGARFAGGLDKFRQLKHIQGIVTANHYSNKTTLCLEDFKNLKFWKFNAFQGADYKLMPQGKLDSYKLGMRFRNYFPELLQDPSGKLRDKLLIYHSVHSRTKKTAEYIVRGLLGLAFDAPTTSLPQIFADERVDYPEYTCPILRAHEPDTRKEASEFQKSSWMDGVIASVCGRLGLPDRSLNISTIKIIYDGCRYQYAWDPFTVSPWCALFSKEDLKVLEYEEDLKYYYKNGPGHPLGTHTACPLAKDLYDRFSLAEKSTESSTVGTIYIGHSSAINSLFNWLGLSLQPGCPPPTARNYLSQQHRSFRSSSIVPFGSNFLAVLYRCSEGAPFQTRIYHNERELTQFCEQGLCDWHQLKGTLGPQVDNPSCLEKGYCYIERKP